MQRGSAPLVGESLKAIHMIVPLFVCLALVACSRKEGVFSLAPAFSALSDAQETIVAECIASYWKQSTRHLTMTSSRGVVHISARSYFRGIPFGARLQHKSHGTVVEFYERRTVPRRYLALLRGCVQLNRGGASADRAQ
ncbi:hypothetical protein P5W99_38360 [Paraburkholderia sp. A3BS-1L]|uniref:hypothetical protein n=1 Tax=Paraburkholderia sp. A3BS-1L TaxID=3028375 RepID=UPI003DA7B328